MYSYTRTDLVEEVTGVVDNACTLMQLLATSKKRGSHAHPVGELIERAISDEAVEARKHSKAYLDLQDRRQGDRQPVSGGRDGRLPASMRTVSSPRHRSASGGTQRLCFSH